MWVYQETNGTSAALPRHAAPDKPIPTADTNGKARGPSYSTEKHEAASAPDRPPETLPHPHAARRAPLHTGRDCALLAGAYLFGTLLAGALWALCSTDEEETLAYYLDCWRALFTLADAEGVAALFVAELITVLGALTVLLLLGFSAIGPAPVFLFTMLYGAGSGLLSLRLLNGLAPTELLLYAGATGVPAAAAAGALCVFGASALDMSARLHAFSFGHGSAVRPAGARGLLGQYLMTAAALLPLCGAATGLAYLAGQLTRPG